MLEQFQNSLKRVNFYLKFIGLGFDSKDNKMTIIERILNHRIYTAHFISFNLEVSAEVLWVVGAIITGKSFLEITYLIPCLTLTFLGNFKSVSFLYYAHHVNELIDTMKNFQSNHTQSEEEIGNRFKKDLIDEHVSMLTSISRKIMYLLVMGLIMFASGPLFIILPHYYKTGELKLVMPFIGYYPFNEFDLRIYPWIYLHQLWTATEAVLMVYGPDCFFFTCCTYVHINFLLLQYDMERVVSENEYEFNKARLKMLAARHIELMRCVNLLEKIFSKSILFNALTSSVIICVTGFNVLEVKNIVVMGSFTVFLIFGLMQILLYSYYGDCIMRSSTQVSDAIYKSQWYNIRAADRKSIFIVLIRAQRPCRLTAYGFFNMNLGAYTSILSTSWSYFALLKTMYHPE